MRTEAEVQAIVDETRFLSEPVNWRCLGGRETNFNVYSNQASDGGKR